MMSGVAAAALATPIVAQDATAADEGGTLAPAEAMPERSFDDTYGAEFEGFADRNVEELLGTAIVNDAGETIGEIENFGLAGDRIVAIAGIGGFLGIDERQVALPLDRLTMQDDALLLSGVTREDLEAMPPFDTASATSLAPDQTLRTGYEAPPPADPETMQPSEMEAADAPMVDVEEEVAEAEAEAEAAEAPQITEADGVDPAADEDEMVESEEIGSGVGAESVEAGEAAAAPDEATASDEGGMAEAAEIEGEMATSESMEAGETAAAPEPSQEDETSETATDGSEPVDAAQDSDDGTAEAAGPVEDAPGAEMTDEPAAAETAETEETEPAIEDATSLTESDTAQASSVDPPQSDTGEAGGWTDEMDSVYADIADRPVAELIGMEVQTADGEIVGDVDNFALAGEDVVAIVGIGGFLGIGQHDVALRLGDMSYDGERLVLSSMTEEDLNEMPEYDDAEPAYLTDEDTLRSGYDR
jgi:sporulation protein YlmC with PRC-barrel domain